MEQKIVGISPQSDEGTVDLEAVLLRRFFDFVAHALARLFAGSRIQQIEAELDVLQLPTLGNLLCPLVRLRPAFHGINIVDPQVDFHGFPLLSVGSSISWRVRSKDRDRVE